MEQDTKSGMPGEGY